MDLVVRVKEIKGRCPVYTEGDTFRLVNGFRLVSDIPICMHGLACTTGGCAYYCCLDGDCNGSTCTSVGMAGNVEVKVCQ